MIDQDDEIIAAAREGFLAEATDMLRLFEDSLLQMERDPSNAEAINSAFRAAHTIKGSAGMFGFNDVVKFTHEVESALDCMREGTLHVTSEGMALLLQSRDQMESLVNAVENPAQFAELEEISVNLGSKLKILRGASDDHHAHAPAHQSSTPASVPAVASSKGVYHISLRLKTDALRNGLDPMSFIRYLSTMDEVHGIRTLTENIPPLDQLDSEACYLGFEIRLASDASKEDIEKVFVFLQEDCELTVLPPNTAPEGYEQLLMQRAPNDASREVLLSHWQALAGPDARPFIERRVEEKSDRRTNDAERRQGSSDRRANSGGDNNRFIRVRADKLDRLLDLIGELVIASSGAQMVAQAEKSPRFIEASLRIHDLVQEARDGALGLRMVPIGETFNRFQRVIRDVSKELGKDVELQITGGDTELDKSMVEAIADPLMHLVRNSLDHGLEPSADRASSGKNPQGRLITQFC